MTDKTTELWTKLSQLQYLLRRRYGHRHSSPTSDATRGQGRILAFLKLRDGISTRDLAYLLDLRVSSLNELLAKLEKNGYIIRTPSEEDKRVMLIYLTEKGRAEEQPERNRDGILNCLSPEEQDQFGDYLDRVIAALEAELGETDQTYQESCRRRHEAFERCFSGHGPTGGHGFHGGGDFQRGPGRGRHRHSQGPCW